jgi:hypothetical protein
MAIESSLPVASPYAPTAVRAVSVRDPNSLARQIPALAVSGVAVSIGAGAPVPLLYNPAGLLRALGTVEKAGALPAGASSSSGSAGLQGNLETVLGLNSDSGFLAGANSAGSLGSLSAGSRQALTSVLADGQGNDQALQQLLAQTLSASSSGQDRTRAAATVVDATGVLRAGSAEQTLKALDSLRTASLGLAARAIDAGSGNTQNLGVTALPGNSGGNADSLAFNRNLSARLEAAVAEIDSERPRRRSLASAGADDLLLSGGSLLAGATDVAAIDAEPALLADQLALELDVPDLALARLALNLPRRAEESLAAGTAAAEFAAELQAIATGSPPPSAPRNAPETADAQATRSALASATEARAAAATPAANATPTVTREPRYAEIAASLSMGAAVYRFQSSVTTAVPPGAVDPLRTVLQIRPIPLVGKVV